MFQLHSHGIPVEPTKSLPHRAYSSFTVVYQQVQSGGAEHYGICYIDEKILSSDKVLIHFTVKQVMFGKTFSISTLVPCTLTLFIHQGSLILSCLRESGPIRNTRRGVWNRKTTTPLYAVLGTPS